MEEIRRQRTQLQKEASLAQQRLHQLAAAQAAAKRDADQPGNDQTHGDPGLMQAYVNAISAAVKAQWQRPSSVPSGQLCPIHIQQLPGGKVVSAKVDSSCEFNDAGQRSIEEAVMNAQPLPYKGFESVFNSDLLFKFRSEDQ